MIQNILDWFAGGANPHAAHGHGPYNYMQLYQCMGADWFWISVTVALELTVAVGYVVIAYHWHQQQKALKPSPAKLALIRMKNIFVFCGLCGYLFIPIKMFWPAWRLYDMTMVILVTVTWRYAWKARDLKVVYAALGRTEKLAEDLEVSQAESRKKSFFLNALSHDLRTPLNGLVLQAELAEVGAASRDESMLRDALAQIKTSAKVTADILNEFLEIGRMDWAQNPNQISSFDLDATLASVLPLYKAEASERKLTLTCSGQSGVKVRTDRIKIERVIGNLVQNALKFTRQGGVEIAVEVIGEDLSIHVSDTGEGIKPEDQDMLFSEFFQVHNRERDRNKGFGLGLAISRRVARLLEGDIRVDSCVGRGSRFTLWLPGTVVSGAGKRTGAFSGQTINAPVVAG